MQLASCIWALLQSAAALRLGRPPAINGTQQLESSELAGKVPLYVDAFFDVNRSQATVILSLSPLYDHHAVPKSEQDKWAKARWVCSWTCPSQQHFARSGGVVLLGPEAPNETAQANINVSRVLQQHVWFHHSLVLSCPLVLPSRCSDLVLGVTATHHDVQIYARGGIRVQDTAFVREGTELAMCTMYDGMHGADLLWPWAKYHVVAGFQQILIYMESTADAAAMPLNDLVASGHVTLVPFYFGSVSNANRFYMQAAMEQHCLFQARGRAAWLGHADVDEFFELRAAAGTTDMKQFLRGLPDDTAAVEVASQHWQVGSHATFAGAPFPCGITCKHPGYFTHSKTKWISRPSEVLLVGPHHVLSDLAVLRPDPESTLRMNHFRHCHRDGNGCKRALKSCAEDTSFKSVCSAAINATLPLGARTS